LLQSYLRLAAYAKKLEIRASLLRKPPWGQIVRRESHQSEYVQSEAKTDLHELLDDHFCGHPSHIDAGAFDAYIATVSATSAFPIPPTPVPLSRLRL
jgi:hypothetical protein